jgi:predicted  nucleic acid-binding Zn-ribbon protein
VIRSYTSDLAKEWNYDKYLIIHCANELGLLNINNYSDNHYIKNENVYKVKKSVEEELEKENSKFQELELEIENLEEVNQNLQSEIEVLKSQNAELQQKLDLIENRETGDC